MSLFKFMAANLAIAVVAAAPTSAMAEIISYSFTTRISNIFEHDASRGVNTFVSASDFAGSSVSLGDIVSGRFSYNADAILNPGYQPEPGTSGTYVIYMLDPLVSQLSFEVVPGAVRFQSGTRGGAYPSLQIANDSSVFKGWDTFFLSANKDYDPLMHQVASLALFDSSGRSFLTGDVPTKLDLEAFSYKRLEAGWVRRSDGNQMHFWGDLQTLVPLFAVPEPSTALLSALGLGMLVALRRKHLPKAIGQA